MTVASMLVVKDTPEKNVKVPILQNLKQIGLMDVKLQPIVFILKGPM